MAKGKGIRMPSLDEVPDGPHRRLLEELHYMYRQAGRPVLRAIVAQANRMDLEGTASQETIRRVLKGLSVPGRWPTMWAIYAPLCVLANIDPDDVYEEDTGGYDEPDRITHRDELQQRWNAAMDDDLPIRHRTKYVPPRVPQNDPWASTTPVSSQDGFGGAKFSDEPLF
ncbi:hypothetical protein ABT352_38750 [Streptosporangium sp. NPDC000563]|uniref:hypothetical protein n=1 Tax=Streptosporangium sp. NPDC000563 TaxID=3154366 RepID=UPI00331EAEA6